MHFVMQQQYCQLCEQTAQSCDTIVKRLVVELVTLSGKLTP